MKFLVLALCVCAASAASFGQPGFTGFQGFKPYSQGPSQVSVQTFASNSPSYNSYKSVPSYTAVPASAPIVQPAAKVVATPVYTPEVTPVATPLAVAKAVVTAPVVAAQAARNYLTKDSQSQVLRANSEINPTNFNYYYEIDNGIAAQAEGALKTIGNEEVLVQHGGYKYILPNGETFELTYVADENGYQPQSAFLPVAPPVPEAIARAIAYTASLQKSQPTQKF